MQERIKLLQQERQILVEASDPQTKKRNGNKPQKEKGNDEIVEKERQRLEILKRRQEKELNQVRLHHSQDKQEAVRHSV